MNDNLDIFNASILVIEAQLNDFVEAKRPADLSMRKLIDISFSWDGKTIILFALRPSWMDATKINEIPFAKIVYTKTSGIWKLYWKRSFGKWENYKPFPFHSNLKELLNEVNQDRLGCFMF